MLCALAYNYTTNHHIDRDVGGGPRWLRMFAGTVMSSFFFTEVVFGLTFGLFLVYREFNLKVGEHCLLACLLARSLACLLARSPARSLACSLARLLADLLTCLLAYLLACLRACLLAR